MVKDPFYHREAEKYESPIASRELIVSYLEKIAKPANLDNIAQAMELKDEDKKEALHRRLRAMERDGQVIFTRRKCYALPTKLAMEKGKVIAHRDGFGFLHIEGKPDDYFLSPKEMRKALHGDVVLAQPIDQQYRGKKEARIVRVLQERNNHIVGRYFIEGNIGFVVPDDQRLNFDILVTEQPPEALNMGMVVVVELLKRSSFKQKASGRIIEVIDESLAAHLAVQIAIRNHDIPDTFSTDVLNEANQFPEQITDRDRENRKDLTALPFITIDGEDARDFDDAVYCTKNKGGGFRLWVAIADVSHYVRPDTAIDKEAYQRSTSVYFPSRVIPMLPERLSNGLCSLNPDVDRLCLVCEMTLSLKGKLTSYQFYDAVIHSHARLTYTKVQKILDGDQDLSKRYEPLIKDINNLYLLYQRLDKTRLERGAIGFESVEPKFIFNAEKRIEQVDIVVRNEAHKIIEECMILANVASAKLVEEQHIPALYRVHDKPDAERLKNLSNLLKELGVSFPITDKLHSKDIAKLMEHIEKRADHEMIQTMILRSMKQAIYDPENRGHFGLALDEYAHFTSPIRRYSDLLLHRTIKWILANQHQQESKTGGYRYNMNEMLHFGEHCSMAERRADEAVRNVIDWLKCDFMQDHVNEIYSGVISSVTNFGFFVRLDNLFIDGLVHVSSLENDYYNFDPSRSSLIGENTGTSYRLGDKVKIKIEAVHLEDRKIDFSLIDNDNKSRRKGKTAKVKSKVTSVSESSKEQGHAKKQTVKKPKKRKSKENKMKHKDSSKKALSK